MARKRSLDDGPAVRTQILDTAARLFYERGFSATSIRQIADAVGVSSSTLYHHFPGKQGVLDAVLTRFANDFVATMLPAVRDPEASPTERVRNAVHAHIAISAARHAELLLGHPIDHALSPAQKERWLRGKRDYHDAMRATVAEGVASGEFRVADVTIATLAMMDMLNGVRDWYRPDGRLSLEEVSAVYVELALAVVGVPRAEVVAAPGPGAGRR
ncbi:TetR/AcrR family transcriptional regulator [Baekduia soli]|uniref:TetR/AcrR family transcriptional regulator n=1 Tax=Baekduia soli TaxID=496014 RepID=UPI0016523F57|nr:TetR/AcrR family transcriptional regulator [Baekduia soli]